MFRSFKVAVIALFLSGAVTSAQLVQRTPASGPSQTVMIQGASKAALVGQSLIHGSAVDANAAPLAYASVRLRNLATSDIEKVSTTDQLGEFTFAVRPEIPYVVEIAAQDGRTIGVGNVVITQAGEVAAASVSAAIGLPAMAGVFGDTARSVVGSAMRAGLTGIEANQAPVVSPDH